MTLSFTRTVLPAFRAGLQHLDHFLDLAASNAQQRGFSPDALVSLRLAPDMLGFASQVRIACDTAKNATARLAGLEAPRFSDDETTFEQLRERIHKTLAWLDTVAADAFDSRLGEDITFPVGREKTRTMIAQDYAQQHALPNFYFHVVTGYNLLRQAGVGLGKMDFLLGRDAVKA